MTTKASLELQLKHARSELKDSKNLLESLAKKTKKEYEEYASITRSKTQKLLAHLKPNGQQSLTQQTRKEETEYLDASRLEARQRDIVNNLDEKVTKLEKQLRDLEGHGTGESRATPPPPSYSPKVSHPGPGSIEPFHLPPLSPTQTGSGSNISRTSMSLRAPERSREEVTLRKSNSMRPASSSRYDGDSPPPDLTAAKNVIDGMHNLSFKDELPRTRSPLDTESNVAQDSGELHRRHSGSRPQRLSQEELDRPLPPPPSPAAPPIPPRPASLSPALQTGLSPPSLALPPRPHSASVSGSRPSVPNGQLHPGLHDHHPHSNLHSIPGTPPDFYPSHGQSFDVDPNMNMSLPPPMSMPMPSIPHSSPAGFVSRGTPMSMPMPSIPGSPYGSPYGPSYGNSHPMMAGFGYDEEPQPHSPSGYAPHSPYAAWGDVPPSPLFRRPSLQAQGQVHVPPPVTGAGTDSLHRITTVHGRTPSIHSTYPDGLSQDQPTAPHHRTQSLRVGPTPNVRPASAAPPSYDTGYTYV